MGIRAVLWGLGGAAVLAAAGAGVRRLRPVEVTGESMLPGLRPGDWLIVRSGARPAPGAVVVAEHPGRPGLLIVKRAVRRTDERARRLVRSDTTGREHPDHPLGLHQVECSLNKQLEKVQLSNI